MSTGRAQTPRAATPRSAVAQRDANHDRILETNKKDTLDRARVQHSLNVQIAKLTLLRKVGDTQYDVPVGAEMAAVKEEDDGLFTRVPRSLTPRPGSAHATTHRGAHVSPSRMGRTKNEDFDAVIARRPRRVAIGPPVIADRSVPLRPLVTDKVLKPPRVAGSTPRVASRFSHVEYTTAPEKNLRLQIEAKKKALVAARVPPQKPHVWEPKLKVGAKVTGPPRCASAIPAR